MTDERFSSHNQHLCYTCGHTCDCGALKSRNESCLACDECMEARAEIYHSEVDPLAVAAIQLGML